MYYGQGDIILLPYPFSDQSDGKARPAVIVSNSLVNGTNDVICAALTTTLRNDKFSYPINQDTLNKPLKDNREGEVRCHKLFLADKKIILAKISSLKTGKYNELFKKIQHLLSPE
jgi:mRNA interferase MazF